MSLSSFEIYIIKQLKETPTYLYIITHIIQHYSIPMSNNPFLQNKPSKYNNRFNFSDEITQFKDRDNTKTHRRYEPTTNSFTKYSSELHTRPHRDSKSKHKDHYTQPQTIQFDNIDIFPNLNTEHCSKTVITNISQLKFKDIITNTTEDTSHTNETDTSSEVPPGWVQISKNNNSIEYTHGPKPTHLSRILELEQQENNPNNIMFKTIGTMINNWNRHETYYDGIHGEGSYEDRFILPPVYGPEYDTDSDYDDEYDDEENSY